MSSLSAAAVKLGETLVKCACAATTGQPIVGELAGVVSAVLGDRAIEWLALRNAKRQLDTIADNVAERVLAQCGHEFRGLGEDERAVVVESVGEVLGMVPPADDLVLGVDFNAVTLERRVRVLTREYVGSRHFGSDEIELYGLLLRMSCAEIVEIVRGLAGLADAAVPEMLGRLTVLAGEIRDAPRRALVEAARTGDNEFAEVYRRYMRDELELIDLDSERLSETSRRYPLGRAYLSLPAQVVRDSGETQMVSIEEAIACHSRVVLRALCGGGKTTHLWRFFGRAIRKDFTGPLSGLNNAVPFYLPLHRFAGKEPPSAEDLLSCVGQDIAAEMPRGWIQRQLRDGESLVLINAVDELPADQRPGVLGRIKKLAGNFPRARFVIAGRPGAVSDEWIAAAGFQAVDLLPMRPGDARTFIHRWHDAVGSTLTDVTARTQVVECADRLIDALASCHALRALSRNPLTCALMCALHRDGKVRLPEQWLDLLKVMVEILVSERDVDRGVVDGLPLPMEQRVRILQDLAYWMTTEDLEHPNLGEALGRVEHLVSGMAVATANGYEKVDAKTVLDHLADRSGLIQVRPDGVLCFTSPVLRHYLAAREAASGGNIRFLVRESHRPERQHLLTMAAGHASVARAEELVSGLLARAQEERDNQDLFHMLAQICLRTAPGLGTELRLRVETDGSLVLPRILKQVDGLAAAGPLVIDALANQPADEIDVALAMVSTAVRIGGDDVLPFLARLAADGRPAMRTALLDAWPQFDLTEYARVVLCGCPPTEIPVSIDNSALIEAAAYVPWLRPGASTTEGGTRGE